jgi:hypothetical protein
MKTRSQTKHVSIIVPTPDKMERPILERPTYVVNIDFDEASDAWYANKKRMPNSMCKYICLGKTKAGNACNRKPMTYTNYCFCHSK